MSDSLLKTCSALSKRTCHRVPVLDSDGNISKLITQFSIISYLYNHRESFQNSLKHTVKELNIGHSPVICAPTTAPALEVFQKMEKSNLSGIAIVNEEGKVVSATSGSDLKLFLRLKVRASLQLSIMQFLNIIRQESLRAKVPVLVCDENATLDTVLAKLFATHEHRIFVIDSQKSFKPIKVISLSDILAAVSGP